MVFCKDHPNRHRLWMRRLSSVLQKVKKFIRRQNINKVNLCAAAPTMLWYAYLDGKKWGVIFAASFPKHHPWFTSTHKGLIETSCKGIYIKWNQLRCGHKGILQNSLGHSVWLFTPQCMASNTVTKLKLPLKPWPNFKDNDNYEEISHIYCTVHHLIIYFTSLQQLYMRVNLDESIQQM